MLIQMSSETSHSLCQNLLSQERKTLWDNKVSNLQKQEVALVGVEVEVASAAAEAVEHQEVAVDLEVEQVAEAEEEEPQEVEEEVIDPKYLLSKSLL